MAEGVEMQQEKQGAGFGSRLLMTLVALVVVLALFYGLDHFIMGIQGLPLNSDLTPAG